VNNKVKYLLNRFKTTEWSGPAWYQIIESDKTKFPKLVSLVYFKPIHLGDGTETELDGDKMGKLLPKVYKRFPDLKDCYLGLIHSHHKMGAFLSGTDKDTAREQAHGDGLFFSTVVASANDPYDCCLTYRDRFGYTNLIDGEVEQQVSAFEVPKEWKKEASYIEKVKKKDAVSYVNSNNQMTIVPSPGFVHGGYYGYGYNSTMYKDKIDETKPEKKQTTLIPQYSWDRQTTVGQDEKDKMEEITERFVEGSITHHDFVEEVRKECPNIDPYSYMDTLSTGGIV
jgi:hypothetical protein